MGISGLLAGGLLLSACHATGTTFVVDTTTDSTDVAPGDGVCADGGGSCSLRAAIMEANALPGVDAITLAAGTTYTLTITGTGEDVAATGDLDVTEGLDIAGGLGTVIDAAGIDRVLDLHLAGGDSVHLSRVVLSGGAEADGAAIRLSAGSLWFFEAEVRDSTASAGAAISNAGGTLGGLSSTFAGNSGTTAGALAQSAGTNMLHNATISDNTGTGGPGGIAAAGGTVQLDNATVVDNAGTTAGGIAQSGGATVLVQGSILGPQASGDDCSGTLGSDGYNLESGTSCGLGGTGDLASTDPALAALADNGGMVRTHSLLPGSAAIDRFPAGAGLCEASLDARAEARPAGSDCDAGAYEVRTLEVDLAGDADDASAGDGSCDTGSGSCTLRAAISEANALPGTDRVAIDGGLGLLELSIEGSTVENANAVGDLDVTDDLKIEANGTTIDASPLIADGHRVLEVDGADTHLRLEDATLTGGREVSTGGGLRVNSSTVDLDHVQVVGNSVAGVQHGGGVAALPGAVMTITDSTISGNTSEGWAGGVFGRGAELTITRSTISGNAAVDRGGAVALWDSATLELVTSTVVGNSSSSSGGAIYALSGSADIRAATIVDNGQDNLDGAAAGSYDLTGSIVANPTSGANCDTGPTYTSGGYNLESGTDCGFVADGDLQGTDPLLEALADNGGTTETHLPTAYSDAVDAIPDGTPGLCDTVTTDQRGVTRPQAGPCDMGAVELEQFVVDEGYDTPDANPGDGLCDDAAGDCTLRAAIDEANATPGVDRIAFTNGLSVSNLSTVAADEDGNAGGDLDITEALVIDTSGVTITQTVSGERVIHSLAPLTIRGGTITGGTLTGGSIGGAGIHAADDLTLVEVTVTGNAASGAGLDAGGVTINATKDLLVERSTIHGNSADDKAGGLCLCGGVGGGTATVVNSTISGNTAGSGGGIWITDGSLELVYATIAGNAGANIDGSSGKPVSLVGTIVADPATGVSCDAGPTYTSAGYNVADDASCNLVATGDQPSTDPGLAPLAYNGDPGPTLTHLPSGTVVGDVIPLGTSLLCDGSILLDQNRGTRPLDSGCDVGSVEL